MKNNNKAKTKFIAGSLSIFICALLLLSGPANALIIGIDVKDKASDTKEFIVWVNPNSESPFKELAVEISPFLERCYFNIDGTMINDSICNSLGIVSIEKIIAPDKPGNGPKYNYGYGYENFDNKRLAYKIVVSSSLEEYTFRFLVKIGNGKKYFIQEKKINQVITNDSDDEKEKKNDKAEKIEDNKTNEASETYNSKDKEKNNEESVEDNMNNGIGKIEEKIEKIEEKLEKKIEKAENKESKNKSNDFENNKNKERESESSNSNVNSNSNGNSHKDSSSSSSLSFSNSGSSRGPENKPDKGSKKK